MGDLPVADVATEHVLAALHPIWTTKPETAARLRGRIEAVLDFARATEMRTGDNPATRAPANHAPTACARARLGRNHAGPMRLGRGPQASNLNVPFQRLRHRRGPKKAICAVAAAILTAAYHMLRDGTFYRDLGPDHYQRASPKALAQRLAKQIAKLGFDGTITGAHPVEAVSV
jgi:hypothetical protein